LTNYSRLSWETSGWTTVYARDEIVGETGWTTFFFDVPFAYNGQDSLMVDFSFNNATYTGDGLCQATSNAQARSLFFRTDSAFGSPLLWNGTNVPGTLSRLSPNLRLLIEDTVPISPNVSGPFVNGTWTGELTVLAPASNLVLRAVDANGHSGDATPIDVLARTDLDGDGLPDAWEQRFFGTDAAAAADDPDGDGLSNLLEYRSGTDPRDGSSLPQITGLELTPAGLRVSFSTVPGRQYQIERCGDLSLNQWHPVGAPQAAQSATSQITDPDGYRSRQHFYRIRVLP